MAAFLRLQFDRSMAMLQADSVWGSAQSHDDQQQQQPTMSHQQLKEERQRKQMEDMSMFLYRLESDFEDKKRRLEKMLFEHPVRVMCVLRFSCCIHSLTICLRCLC